MKCVCSVCVSVFIFSTQLTVLQTQANANERDKMEWQANGFYNISYLYMYYLVFYRSEARNRMSSFNHCVSFFCIDRFRSSSTSYATATVVAVCVCFFSLFLLCVLSKCRTGML